MKLTKDNAKQILTYKPDPEDERDYIFSSSIRGNVEKAMAKMPSALSYRSNMTSVKNQGGLGSCVGFAITAMKEWQEKIEHEAEIAEGKRDHRDGKEYNLSESWVYWNCKKIDPWPNEEGTSIRYAMKVLQKLGTPSEGAWPYDDRVKGEPKSWATLVSRWARIGDYWRVNNLQELKLALVETGPFVIGVPCFEEIFDSGYKGDIPYPKNPNIIYGGHALCVVGYNDPKQKVLFKNSWGTGWGSGGYGTLPYQYIDDFLWDAWTCKDVKMTKRMLKEAKALL